MGCSLLPFMLIWLLTQQLILLFPGFKPQTLIKEDSFVDLYPVVCHSPCHFYCQVMGVEQIAALKELMDELQVYYDTLSEKDQQLSRPEVGMSCTAKFTGQSLVFGVR